MRDLDDKKLIELGFKLINVSPEEAGDEVGFCYYVYSLYNGEGLITQTDSERTDEFFDIEFVMMEDAGQYSNSVDVTKLINSIKRM